MTTELNWNLLDDIRQLLSFHFMLNALRAGTIVAVVAGAVGYLMVLRRQTFAGHTLALIGFPGAAGATWLGLNAAVGYFGFCVAGALIISALPGSGRPHAGLDGFSEESAAIGSVQAFASLRVSLRQPLQRLPQRSEQPAVRDHHRHHRSAGPRIADRRCWLPAGADGAGPPVAVFHH